MELNKRDDISYHFINNDISTINKLMRSPKQSLSWKMDDMINIHILSSIMDHLSSKHPKMGEHIEHHGSL